MSARRKARLKAVKEARKSSRPDFPEPGSGRVVEWGFVGDVSPEMLADAKRRLNIPEGMPPSDLPEAGSGLEHESEEE